MSHADALRIPTKPVQNWHTQLWWANSIGACTLIGWLQPLQALGKRFEPTPPLLDAAMNGTEFEVRTKAAA